MCLYIHVYLYLNFGAGPRGLRGARMPELRFGIKNTVGSFERFPRV